MPEPLVAAVVDTEIFVAEGTTVADPEDDPEVVTVIEGGPNVPPVVAPSKTDYYYYYYEGVIYLCATDHIYISPP